MPRPRRKGRFIHGKPETHIVEGEVLHIGAHPNGYSNLQHIVLGLTNTQAEEYSLLGWDVRFVCKGDSFLGKIQDELIFYIVIDIPKHFEDGKISFWRMESYLENTNRAVVEFIAQQWTYEYFDTRRPSKHDSQLTLTEIYTVDDTPDEEKSVIDTVREERNTLREQYLANGFREITQREWDNRNNPTKSHWNVGDAVSVAEVHYQVGHILDGKTFWVIRLDRKWGESLILSVPK